MTDINNDHLALLRTINLVVTVPSFIGSLLMAYFCYITLSVDFIIKLIFALAISDALYSLSNGMATLNYTEDSTACKIEGSLRLFSLLLTMFWAATIAILHYKLVDPNANFKKSRFLVLSTVIGLTLSLGLSLR